MLTAIVGINWGDEGKGRMVDLLSERYDIVCRYQGGNNAGHTVMNEKGTFILNLLPSGILRDETVNIMGPGMVIDVEHLFNEVKKLRDAGIVITPEHLKISSKATICMPYHKLLDCLEEERLADKKFGSTRRGIAPVYADKYYKKTLRMGDILSPDSIFEKLDGIVEWKNLTIKNGYGHEGIKTEDMMKWLETYAYPFRDYICDTTNYLND
ncbi:MAG: adenylosuccinate synthetase, partial [Acutalibacteraceae bacterium]